MVSIGVLTSSRADFGVYLPLLQRMREDHSINLIIIAFGTHLSKFHGYTINDIIENNFVVKYSIPTLLSSDTEEGISTSTSLCSLKFSSFWAEHKKEMDLIFCLGDRYEMYAAVSAGVPFGLKFAHLYGGDISLGAIDDIYRDCLSIMASLHFTSTERCAERVRLLKRGKEPVEVVGILSLDDIQDVTLPSLDEFKLQWAIDLSIPSVLITFHPETVNPEQNLKFSEIIYETCLELGSHFQLIITMPNADTENFIIRRKYQELKDNLQEKIFMVENFGRIPYFTCMKNSVVVIGNSSSGISEAASFNKFFINIGSRQKGREMGENIINVDYNRKEIVSAVYKVCRNPIYNGKNIYHKSGSSEKIIKIIKEKITPF